MPAVAIAVALVAILLPACSVSTAHIGNLQVARDKDMSTPTSSFGAHDAVYAKASADNLPNKVSLNWQLIAEKVDGQKPNTAIPRNATRYKERRIHRGSITLLRRKDPRKQ